MDQVQGSHLLSVCLLCGTLGFAGGLLTASWILLGIFEYLVKKRSFQGAGGEVRVLSYLPLWRYAVGPASEHSPAITFFSKKEAEGLFEELKRDLPLAGVVLYKRDGWRGIRRVKEHLPGYVTQTPTSAVRGDGTGEAPWARLPKSVSGQS